MTSDSASSKKRSQYDPWRAPRDDRQALISPPLDDAAETLRNNLGVLNESDGDWQTLRSEARSQLIADAIRYTSVYRDVDQWRNATAATPVVMAGHQPTLFHPGVWFKNFTLSHVGAVCRATPINLVIDNDVAGTPGVRVPVVSNRGSVTSENVLYDVAGGGVPHEQSAIQNPDVFNSFDERLAQTVAPLVGDPSVRTLWPHAKEALKRCGVAGCALAQARHALEAGLGWKTLELPLGAAVRGLPFSRFAMLILGQMERFADVYNGSADHYRAWHHIRSTAHPVPNLGTDDDWIETPFWLYGDDSPSRRGVWTRRVGDRIELSDRVDRRLELDGSNPDRAALQLAEAASPQFKLRPRALVTTMFARLVLSDLFLHGIGGGKYDQLADQIIRRFFEIEPPVFQVVTATMRLPGVRVDVDRPAQVANLRRQIRQTRYQGEQWLDPENPDDAEYIRQKAELLATMPPSGHRADWHRRITAINESISIRLADRRGELRTELAHLAQSASDERIFASREHAFCLFPISAIQTAFADMIKSRT